MNTKLSFPYCRSIIPVETGIVSVLTMGEGWHNYHHTFPWDYRASEYGQYFNVTTSVINFLSQYGWLYDLRAATPEMVMHRILKQGDGTHLKLEEMYKTMQTIKDVPITEELNIDEEKTERCADNLQSEEKRQKKRTKGSM